MNPSLPAKSEIRTALRRARRALDPQEHELLSERAARYIMGQKAWRDARVVALYIAVRGEMDTKALFSGAEAEGKTILLPRCSEDQAGCMELFPYTGPECLHTGAFTIPEPPCGNTCEIPPPDLIIIPGVAFDTTGIRLGMGAGYYDRLLIRPEYARAVRIGMAFAFQIQEMLPREPWDIPVHAVCTEKGCLWLPLLQ